MIGPSVSISRRQRRVTFQNPGPPVPDGEGGFVPSWLDLPPPADARIEPATAESLERVASGSTVLATATHIVTVPYREGISTKTRLLVDGRTLPVTSVRDPDERHVELVLVCSEAV